MYMWLCCLSVFLLTESTVAQEDIQMTRVVRNFPYSVNLYRLLGHDRELRPYYGVNDEVAELIDGLNTQPEPPRFRRSGMNGYACRFKFCRIFDA